jgi:hypothetical protein
MKMRSTYFATLILGTSLATTKGSAQTRQEADARFMEMYRLTEMPVNFEMLTRRERPSSIPGSTIFEYRYFENGISIEAAVIGQHLKHINVSRAQSSNRPVRAVSTTIARNNTERAVRNLISKIPHSRPVTVTFNWTGNRFSTITSVDGYKILDATWATGSFNASGQISSLAFRCSPLNFQPTTKSVSVAQIKSRIPAGESSVMQRFSLVWVCPPKQLSTCVLAMQYSISAKDGTGSYVRIRRDARTGKVLQKITEGRVLPKKVLTSKH